METTNLVTEFITHTGANTQDAVSCLKSWEWDLKKALIDYNDTSTTEYFNNKKNKHEGLLKTQSSTTISTSSLYESTLLSGTTSSMLQPDNSSILSSASWSNNAHLRPQAQHHGNDSQCSYLINERIANINLDCGDSSTTRASAHVTTSLHISTPSVKLPTSAPAAVKLNHNPQHNHYIKTGSSSIGTNADSYYESGMNYASISHMPIVHLKPMLAKADSVDILDSKKLERGISRATENVTLVSRARQEFEMDFHAHIHTQNDKNLNFIDTPDYTFTLPDLTKYTDDFRKFLEKDLIESSTLNSLEATNRLNWWFDSGTCRKLWPLATTGDGNCLLHAASLAMWGFHDRRLTLRRTLHDILSKEEFRDALYRRWRFQQTRVNRQAGFVFCESEWAKEWDEIVAIASPEPRRNINSAGPSRRRSLLIEKSFDSVANGLSSTTICDEDENATYESLEEIHVLALAHILRRTIIVVSDVFLRDINGEAFSPIPFGGVYLPFEVPSNECHRTPLLLAYDMAHFSALVAMEGSNDSPPALIPLVDDTNQLLPIQFCIDPGKDFNWHEYDGSHGNWTLTDREHVALLKEYLDIVHATGIECLDDEIYYDDYSDDEYEKKIGDGEIALTADENYNHNVGSTSTGSISASNQSLPIGGNGKDVGGKSKAAKQLQSVAKQFGSIGKSMSRKLRKNIGSITRIGSKNNHIGTNTGGIKKSHLNQKHNHRCDYPRLRILCAQLKSRRHEYQEEMIKNYLECAQERFLESEKLRDKKEIDRLAKYVAEVGQCVDHNGIGDDTVDNPEFSDMNACGSVNCINVGCQNYGTAATSYMCTGCYEMQCKRETSNSKGFNPINMYSTDYSLRYGTGKSKFYTEADLDAHDRIQKLPSARLLNDLDQTLYLSRSTFYNDIKSEEINRLGNAFSFRQKGPKPNDSLELSPATDGFIIKKSHLHHLVQNQHHQNYSTSSSHGIVASISPPEVIINNSQISSHVPSFNNRPAAMCVVNLPPVVVNSNNDSMTVGQFVANNYNETPTSYSSILNDTIRSLQPFSSSSSSSSIGCVGGSSVQSPFPIVNSNNYSKNQLCRTQGCKYYGNINTNFYCSKCCQEYNI
ncbi:uncharacterized protein LOC128724984 [Anopheles nili]|uniref:uncharacterized protein LOC128724984 n=1 Tax=Anopheles nili TaxID=185578 RepID=UPI00237BEDC7|nr:uncharacterized protein LOC128724984 [Anopheles nili]